MNSLDFIEAHRTRKEMTARETIPDYWQNTFANIS